MKKAKFISIEGGDGAGKSSVMQTIKEGLENKGIPCIVTREPGGTLLGQELRGLILSNDFGDIDPKAELFMLQAARAQHIKEVILPNLKNGITVISDRYVDSLYAYQGARGLDKKIMDQTTELATGGLMPHNTIYLDLDPVVGMMRAKGRAKLDRIELAGLEFHKKVRDIFLERAKNEPSRIIVVNASKTIDLVKSDIIDIVDKIGSAKGRRMPNKIELGIQYGPGY
jgi:dTMP kinase